MKSKEKNLIIIGLFLIIFVFFWTFSSYFKLKKDNINKQNEQIELEKIKVENEEKAIEEIPIIKISELKKILIKDDSTIVVDLRSDEEYQKGHIINSISYKDLSTEVGKKIILVSEKSIDKGVVSIYKSLTEQNNQVSFLEGGIVAWKNSGGTTISLGDPNSMSDVAKVNFVEPRDVAEIIKNNSDSILIIDTRKEGNFKTERIPNSINIPLSELEKKYKNIITERKNIYIYGTDNISSFSSGVIIYDLGFFNAKTINGGFEAWKKYGYEIKIGE